MMVSDIASLAGRTILLVEDEYVLAMELEAILRRAGATVIGPVASVVQALRLVEQDKRIDAAILDVNVGGEMVYPVADRLIERGVSLLFTTGYHERDLPDRYAQQPRCEKPLEAARVARLITQALQPH